MRKHAPARRGRGTLSFWSADAFTTSTRTLALAAALAVATASCGGDERDRANRGGAPARSPLALAPVFAHGPAVLQTLDLNPEGRKLVIVDFRRGLETHLSVGIENRGAALTVTSVQADPGSTGFLAAAPALIEKMAPGLGDPATASSREPVRLERGEMLGARIPIDMPASSDPTGKDDGRIDWNCFQRKGGGRFVHKVVIATELRVRYEQGGRAQTARLKLDAPWVGVASRC